MYIKSTRKSQKSLLFGHFLKFFSFQLLIFSRKKNIASEESLNYSEITGARGGVVVKALRYKPAGRGFDS
jgi:hypothetical protein